MESTRSSPGSREHRAHGQEHEPTKITAQEPVQTHKPKGDEGVASGKVNKDQTEGGGKEEKDGGKGGRGRK